MIAEFSIVPIGGDQSLSAYIAEAYSILAATGLPCERHAMGTNLEGDWDDIMAAINACRIRLLAVTGRVSITIRIDDRVGEADRLRRKVPSAERKMVD